MTKKLLSDADIDSVADHSVKLASRMLQLFDLYHDNAGVQEKIQSPVEFQAFGIALGSCFSAMNKGTVDILFAKLREVVDRTITDINSPVVDAEAESAGE